MPGASVDTPGIQGILKWFPLRGHILFGKTE